MAPPLLPNGAEAIFKTELAVTIFYWIGLGTTLLFATRVFRFIQLHTRSSSISRYHHRADGSPDSQSSAPWAVITGSSDGIGLNIARELAKARFNIVLHGRNPIKLQTRKDELEKAFPGIGIRFVVADASASSASGKNGIEEAANELQGLRITVLVNNVGGIEPIMYPAPREFYKTTPAEIDGVINLNSRFPTQFTRALMPILMAHKGPVLIMNIGSLGDSGVPYVAVYSGAKAFNMGWSRAMSVEVAVDGLDIEVLGIGVGQVTDCAHNKSKPTFLEPSAADMAKSAVSKVGCGKDFVVAHFSHALAIASVKYLPKRVVQQVTTTKMKELWEKQLKQL